MLAWRVTNNGRFDSVQLSAAKLEELSSGVCSQSGPPFDPRICAQTLLCRAMRKVTYMKHGR
jgi:hypothetical protein